MILISGLAELLEIVLFFADVFSEIDTNFCKLFSVAEPEVRRFFRARTDFSISRRVTSALEEIWFFLERHSPESVSSVEGDRFRPHIYVQVFLPASSKPFRS